MAALKSAGFFQIPSGNLTVAATLPQLAALLSPAFVIPQGVRALLIQSEAQNLRWRDDNTKVATVAVATNVATLTTQQPHNLAVGNNIVVSGLTNPAAGNGNYTIASVPNSTTITYPITAANLATTADVTGFVMPAVTATVGQLLVSGNSLYYEFGNWQAVQFIQVTAGGILNVTLYIGA